MAITLTTLVGAVTVDQNNITVASATGLLGGLIITVDQEPMQVQKIYPVTGQATTFVPVLRGLDGSANQAHPTGAQVRIYGLPSDLPVNAPQEVVSTPIGSPGRTRTSYTAAGAITLPLPGNDTDAVLNGTSVLAMTLANPTTDMDGCRLAIMGNGKAAHTVTYTAGLGNVGSTADVITYSATQAQAFNLVACGGFWLALGPSATATASVSGPSIA